MMAALAWLSSAGAIIRKSRWAQGIALVIAGVALFLALNRCAQFAMTTVTRSATEAGVQQERADHHQETIRQTEKANAAADKVRRDGGAARDDCLRDSRTPENC